MKPTLISAFALFSVFLVSFTGHESAEYKMPETPEEEIPTCFWAKKIKPDKHYDYWAYGGYNLHYFYDKPVVKEAGDTLYRKYTLQKPPNHGFFWGAIRTFAPNLSLQ